MRSRVARFTSSALACLTLGGAAWFLNDVEHSIASRRLSLRQFDVRARETVMTVVDVRLAQEAYLASGQSAEFWIPKVAGAIPAATSTLDTLRSQAATDRARHLLLDAAATLAELTTIDKRVREYLVADQQLMAGDVVFSEGLEAAAKATQQIEAARLAEHQGFDMSEAGQRRLQAYAMGGAAGFTAFILLLLSFAPRAVVAAADATDRATDRDKASRPDEASLVVTKREEEEPSKSPSAADVPGEEPRDAMLALGSAADLCTAFGRVQDLADLKRVLAGVATAIDASGLIVWLGNSAGADLRPVVAHGYSEQLMSLMRAIPRHADNAAAAAYRTGKLQIVPAKPGTSLGAVVAPILCVEGCVGALAAEIKDNGEISETVHTLAVIVASQLAGVLSSSTDASSPGAQAAAI
jgi:hypothetical protein